MTVVIRREASRFKWDNSSEHFAFHKNVPEEADNEDDLPLSQK